MTPIQQLMLGVGASKKTYMDDVFSTHMYTGTGASGNTINNGIDLSGEGGLVWVKRTNGTSSGRIFDTERGGSKYSVPSDATAQATTGNTGFNNNGFTVNETWLDINYNTVPYAAWTFRKAPGFFDVVTWTGNGSNRTIAHSLGSVPGMIMVKRLDGVDNWVTYHRGNADSNSAGHYFLRLDTNSAKQDSSSRFNDTEPTASVFSIGTDGGLNDNGGSYLAYLFAVSYTHLTLPTTPYV